MTQSLPPSPGECGQCGQGQCGLCPCAGACPGPQDADLALPASHRPGPSRWWNFLLQLAPLVAGRMLRVLLFFFGDGGMGG